MPARRVVVVGAGFAGLAAAEALTARGAEVIVFEARDRVGGRVRSARLENGAVVEFSELVAHQDYTVCERVQQGVRSRAFTHGVYAEKDELPYRFTQRYLAALDRP